MYGEDLRSSLRQRAPSKSLARQVFSSLLTWRIAGSLQDVEPFVEPSGPNVAVRELHVIGVPALDVVVLADVLEDPADLARRADDDRVTLVELSVVPVELS